MVAPLSSPGVRASSWRPDAPALYPYQLDGIEWMRRRGSFLLWDDQGVGKTAQALAAFCETREHKPTARLLVVASNFVIVKWKAEVHKWTSLSCEVVTGTAAQRRAALACGADVLVIAYDNLARELDNLNAQGFYMIVFDEAHNIKNVKAKRTIAAFALRGVRRAVMTGSPMPNRVDELWPQLFLVAPTEFGSYWSFLNKYAVYGGWENRQIIGAQNITDLRQRYGPHALRRMKSEVARDLPPKTVVVQPVTLSGVQKKMYDTALNELKIEIEGKTTDEFTNPLTRFLRLRQILGTPACVGGPDVSVKLDAAMAALDEIGPEHKVVVFSQFLGVIAGMRRRLTEAAISHDVIQGEGMTATSRSKIIEDFQTKADPRVLVASYGVSREGIDLYAASYAIMLDKLWVPSLQTQAEDRLHRRGQTKNVTIIEILAEKTVETRVEKLLNQKRQAFDAVISEDSLSRLLAENMRDLLE